MVQKIWGTRVQRGSQLQEKQKQNKAQDRKVAEKQPHAFPLFISFPLCIIATPIIIARIQNILKKFIMAHTSTSIN